MSTVQGRLLRIRKAALLLNISKQAHWKWVKHGEIDAVKLPSRRYRIPASEIVRIIHFLLQQVSLLVVAKRLVATSDTSQFRFLVHNAI
jgi:excisionase family DNA binding protein